MDYIADMSGKNKENKHNCWEGKNELTMLEMSSQNEKIAVKRGPEPLYSAALFYNHIQLGHTEEWTSSDSNFGKMR